MECPHAYLKQNIDYVLCKKEPEPDGRDLKALFHAVCPHQVACPKRNCHLLSANWGRCVKLAERPSEASGSDSGEAVQTQDEATEKRSRKRRTAQAEE